MIKKKMGCANRKKQENTHFLRGERHAKARKKKKKKNEKKHAKIFIQPTKKRARKVVLRRRLR
jgi:ribosomal protein S25